MALPAGAATATITVGVSTDIAGEAGTITGLAVRPECRLVWAATGQPIEDWNVGAIDAATATLVVLADQDGVVTSGTVAGAPALVAIRSWPMVAVWWVKSADGQQRKIIRRFPASLLAAGGALDLDLLPAHGVVPPAQITYAQRLHFGTGSPEEIGAEVAAYLLANPPALTDLSDVEIGDSTPGDVMTVDEAGVWGPAAIPAPDLTGYVQTTDARLSDARTPTAHAASHKTAGADALTAADIGAQPAGSYAAASHTQAASTISDSTTVGRSVLTAVDAAAARTAIGAGTSSLAIGTTGTTAAAGNRAASETAIGMVELATTAEATTGTDTTRAVTPAGLKAAADTKAPAATAVTTDTTQTITGAKTMTAPTMVAAVPAATFGADLTPAGGL